MERQKFFAAGAGTAAAILLAAQTGVAPAAANSLLVSDTDVWRVRGRITGMIAQLSDLAGDYAGNRMAALGALTQAKQELDAAIRVRGLNNPLSDAVMRAGLEETNEMIQRLTNDTAGYNNHKDQALVRLNQARTSLQAALRTA